MTLKILLMRKHRKPPYAVAIAILLLVVSTNVGGAETENGVEEPEDNFEILMETSPYSIKFSLNDTENYELQNVSCKNVKNVEAGVENSCDNLDPCSTYLATLHIKYLKEENEPIKEKTMDASTDYKEPLVEIDEVIAYQEKINLTWHAADSCCISSYQIEVASVDKEFKWTIANDKNELLIDGLNPCQDHTIKLKTYDINDKLISNLTKNVATTYAEPENVAVTIEDYENAQVKVSWDPPKYKTCINYYHLKWFIPSCVPKAATMQGSIEGEPSNPGPEEGVCEWTADLTDPNAKEYIISDLQGCETYGFNIYINSNATAKFEQQQFLSPEQLPGTVVAQSPVTGSTNMHLYWEPPQTHPKCVSYYKVDVTGPLQRDEELQETNVISTSGHDVLFEDLDPCGHYNYSIIAISLNGTAAVAVNATFDTLEAKPTRVRHHYVLAKPNSLEITWEPPAFADLCLNGYRLSGWMDENESDPAFDKTTNDTRVVVEKLYSCQSYTIQIIPTTKTMDGDLMHIETETAAIAAQQPTNFQETGVFHDSIEFSAQDSDLNNKCETIFARFVCELSKNVDVPFKTAEVYGDEQVGGISFKGLLAPLSPFTDYKCNVALYNIAGWSPNMTRLTKTGPYFPDPPEKVGLKTSTSSAINFNWAAPKYPNGNIKLYISNFQRVGAGYYVPPDCSPVITEPISRETSSLEQSFTGLLPYTAYSIQVAAQNEYGIGKYTTSYRVLTEPWISEPVFHLKVVPEGPYASHTEYKANAVVTWTAPCRSNGEIESFELEFMGERYNHAREHFFRSVLPDFNEDGTITYNETNLQPEYNYSVSVRVKTRGVEVVSNEIRSTFDSPAGIPQTLNDTAIGQTKVNAYEANNPTHSAVVRFPADILESESGTIMFIALLLSEKGCNPEPQLEFGALNSNQDWPDTASWNEVYKGSNSNCIYQYQTTPVRWRPTRTRDAGSIDARFERDDEDDEIEYIIGTEKCEGTTRRYCNGQLKADTEYHLVIRLFTKSGYNDAAKLDFKTDSLIELTIIIISVCSCLLLAFIAGFIYLWVTKRIIWHRESCHGIEDSFGDIISKNFAIFYRDVAKPEKIAREFKELTVVALDLSYSASELGCNKNRYADIFPYDKNRVILDIDAEGSDYINASFIDGYRRKKEYIATQGPKPESTMDFWRMVLQHNVRVIVMVTQFREGDIVKCFEYFPFKSKGINVVVKKKETFELYDRTEMTVTHDKYGLKQKVVHFYFKKWPDHGVPGDPMNLVTFVRKVKAEKVPSYSPIVVHCSAGVGRTGTFIGLDIIMQRLKSEAKINIYETVKKLRFQRMKMVQTMAQYTFLYTCAYELVKHKNTRAALKYQSKGSKKVSFQDEPELSIVTTMGGPTTKFNGRRIVADLSAVDEDEVEAVRNDALWRQPDVVRYGTVPIRFSGLSKPSDLESMSEENNTESVM